MWSRALSYSPEGTGRGSDPSAKPIFRHRGPRAVVQAYRITGSLDPAGCARCSATEPPARYPRPRRSWRRCCCSARPRPRRAAGHGPRPGSGHGRSGPIGAAVPSGFVGLSTEYGAVRPTPAPIHRRSIRCSCPCSRISTRPAAAPCASAVTAVTGRGGRWQAWPARRGSTTRLTPRWLAVTRALAAGHARACHARHQPRGRQHPAGRDGGSHPARRRGPPARPARWRSAMSPSTTRPAVVPDADGAPVPGRPAGYDPAQYNADFAASPACCPGPRLPGRPPGARLGESDLPALWAHESRLAVATVHRYPLNRCVTDPANPRLSDPGQPARGPQLARADPRPCRRGGAGPRPRPRPPGGRAQRRHLSGPDRGQRYVRVGAVDAGHPVRGCPLGIDGVNIHVWPGAVPNELFTFRHHAPAGQAPCRPSYYGALFFTEAAPPRGPRFLPVASSGAGGRSGYGRPAALTTGLTGRPDQPQRPPPDSVAVRLPARALAPAAVAALRAPALAPAPASPWVDAASDW